MVNKRVEVSGNGAEVQINAAHKNAGWCAKVFTAIVCVTIIQLLSVSPVAAQVQIPNVQQGAPGTLLRGPVDSAMGRTAIIEFMDGYIVTIPETPGSEPGDHQTTKAWNISDPRNPFAQQPINPNQNGGHFGRTGNPFLAHGAIRRDNELYFQSGVGNSGNRLDALRLNDDGTLEHVRWSGQTAPPIYDRNGNRDGNEYARWWSKGGLYRPWAFPDDWMYNSSPELPARLTLRDRLLARWDIRADTGVTGFGLFMGNLLIYASDQRSTGVAVYDATDISFDSASGEWKPRLLDTLNTPLSEGGIGGYWSEISGHYLIFARQERKDLNPNFFAGMQVVDFSDPNNLKLHCNIQFQSELAKHHWTLRPLPQYVGVQDEFAFVDSYKVNIETCEVVLALDKSQGRRGNQCYTSENPCPMVRLDTSQYSRVVGNLWLTGGYPHMPNTDGMGIWVHQSEPDKRPPYIAHHIPAANQINYSPDAPLSFSVPETLSSTSIVVTATADPGEAQTLTVNEVNGGPVDIDYVISHTGMITVEPLNGLKADTTYEVSFTNGIKDAVGNSMQPYSFRFSTGSTIIDGNPDDPAVIDGIDLSPGREILIDESVTVSVRSSNASEYEIILDSESNRWRSENSRSFSFPASGNYSINVRARNGDGPSDLQRISITVSPPDTLPPGIHSSQLSCSGLSGQVWAVNQDNDSVTVLDASLVQKIDEITGIDGPRSVVQVADDEVWVAARDSDQIVVLDSNSYSVKRAVSTGYGSAPTHLLANADGSEVYVSLYGTGQVVRYSVNDKTQIGSRITLAPSVKSMALSPDGRRLLVARFQSVNGFGEVYEINVSNWTRQRVYRLTKHTVDDDQDEGRGVPNYLDGIVINGAGNRAYVVGKKDNVDRGLLNTLNQDLDDDNTVRTIGITLDLDRGVELKGQRIDFDNTSSLSGLSMSDDSRILFVAMQGKNSVLAMEIGDDYRFTGQTYDYPVGLAPQGMCFDGEQNKLFVKNFTERSVTSLDFENGYLSPETTSVSTVANEALTPSELSGLQVFYNAFAGLTNSNPIGKMSAEGYISCASCHIEGSEDGNVYDFTGRGEGLRNTISLRGRGGTRFGDVHWSANFDEIQDFEHDIRDAFKGRGFMADADFAAADTPLGSPKAGFSQELDDMAAYVASLGKESLPRSPNRKFDGSMTEAALAGEQTFASLGCIDCHSGSAMTDTNSHDVGTLRVHSGSRLGETLSGIKTPSLLGVFATAPYLHDGSAATLEKVFSTVGGQVIQAEDGTVVKGSVVRQPGYSYLRNGAGMRLNGNGASVSQSVDAGSDGRVRLRIRYGSAVGSSASNGGEIRIKVNNESRVRQTIVLKSLPRVDGQDAMFDETESFEVALDAGSQNLVLEYQGSSVIIDEITLATGQQLDAAQPHLQVASITTLDRNNLLAFLEQVDQDSAPEDDDDDIFSNDGGGGGGGTPAKLSVRDTSFSETVGTGMIEAQLSRAVSNDVVFRVHTRDGSATQGTDYYGFTQQLTVKAGETSVNIPVTVLYDGVVEGDEQFSVRIIEASGADIEKAIATVGIVDDNGGQPIVSIASGEVTEGADYQLTVTLSAPSSSEVSVQLATNPGTAKPGSDYFGIYKVVTFAPGEVSKSVTVKVLDDTEVESDETFKHRLFGAKGAIVVRAESSTTIKDND